MKRSLYNEQEIRDEVFSLFDVKPLVLPALPKVQVVPRAIKTRRREDAHDVAMSGSHRRRSNSGECTQVLLGAAPRMFSHEDILHQVKQDLKQHCDSEECNSVYKNNQITRIDMNLITYHDHSKPPFSPSKTAPTDSFSCQSRCEVDDAVILTSRLT